MRNKPIAQIIYLFCEICVISGTYKDLDHYSLLIRLSKNSPGA